MRGVGYRKYDNYDAIEVPFVDAIPSDHDGMMGVPITFLDSYNPDQFEIVTLSIDHREGPELATAYKKGYIEQYARPGAENGWHFLTGDETAIRRLASSTGILT